MDSVRSFAGARVGRRTLLARLVGVAGAAFALGSDRLVAASVQAAAPPGAPSVLAALPSSSPSVLAQAGGTTRVLLAADFAEIRAKIAGQAWARDSFAALKRAADGLVKSRPPIPEQGGGWFHAGGAGYEVTRVHTRLAEGVRTLGLAYRLTDDPAYAQAAGEILLEYTARYQGYELHDTQGRTGSAAWNGGKALAQGLDESSWLAALATGYDLVRDALPATEREQIAGGVLRPAADLLVGYNLGRSNIQAHYNQGIGLAGFALDDARYVEHAIGKPDSGLLFQLGPDGC